MARLVVAAASALALSLGAGPVISPDSIAARSADSPSKEVSFQQDVMPIIKRQCLPCHAGDNFNPSELSLDSRDLLMAGGKHGVPVIPGNADRSILYQKIGPNPPFGDRMPLDPKKKRGTASTKSMSEEEIRTIREWIERGAKGD